MPTQEREVSPTKAKPSPCKLDPEFQPLCMENFEWTLERDAELGYRPRLDHIDGPLPFVFLSHNQLTVIKIMEELGETCVYKAKRPKNSFDVHETNLKSGSAYEVVDPSFKLLTDKGVQNIIHNNVKGCSRVKDESQFPLAFSNNLHESNNPAKSANHGNLTAQSSVEFDSEFENGNLDLVFKVSNSEYNLFTRCDTNSRGHNQGFHFRVKAYCANDIRLNIINMVKPNSLFGRGSFPYWAYRDKNGKLVWQQLDSSCKISYVRTNQKYQISPEGQKKRIYMTLSFSYKMEAGQERWFAYSIPYHYSDLLGYLNSLSNNHLASQVSKVDHAEPYTAHSSKARPLFFRKWESPFVRMESLCKSESLLDVPLLTITDFSASDRGLTDIAHRPVVYIVSRVHPSESVASYSIEGFINKLLDGSSINRALLKLLVFKIVPMINPDGVVVGNFRTNLSGEDLNRRYDTPSRAFHPTVRSADSGPRAEGAHRRRHGSGSSHVRHVRFPRPQFSA